MQVYTEYDIFEEVFLFPEKYPNWTEVLKRHAHVCVNLTKEEYAGKLDKGEAEILWLHLHAWDGKSLPLPSHFTIIEENAEVMLENPRAAYILKVTKEKAAELTQELGLVVQSNSSLDDEVLVKPSMYRELPKDRVFDSKGKKGWHLLLDFNRPPANAMVVVDPYLLTSPNGLSNLTQLCDAILPTNLKVTFHVCVITSHITGSGANTVTRPESWRIQEAGKVAAAVKALRKTYSIEVEVVFEKSTEYHRRRVVLNYATLTCDRGLEVFKGARGNTVGEANDASFKRVFHDPTVIGDTQYASATADLKVIDRRSRILAAHITNKTALDPGSIMGDCNKNKTLKNRLVNDV